MNKSFFCYHCIVNKILRITGAVFLLSVYCFATGNSWYLLKISAFQDITSKNDLYGYDVFSSFLLNITKSTEESLKEPGNFPVQNVKNAFFKLNPAIKSKEIFIENKCHQYIVISLEILVTYRKSDIIFPFQYFW